MRRSSDEEPPDGGSATRNQRSPSIRPGAWGERERERGGGSRGMTKKNWIRPTPLTNPKKIEIDPASVAYKQAHLLSVAVARQSSHRTHGVIQKNLRGEYLL